MPLAPDVVPIMPALIEVSVLVGAEAPLTGFHELVSDGVLSSTYSARPLPSARKRPVPAFDATVRMMPVGSGVIGAAAAAALVSGAIAPAAELVSMLFALR